MPKPAYMQRWLLAFAGSMLLAACSSETEELRFVRPASSIDQEIAEDLAALFNNESHLHIELSEGVLSGDSALDAILAGEADIALVSNALQFRDGITTAIPLYPTVLHIGYPADRVFVDGTDLLRGSRIYAGAEGSASRHMLAQSAARLGLKETDYSFVSDLTGGFDIIVVFAPISPDRLKDYPDFRLFSFGPPNSIGTGATIDSATLLNPYLKPFVIPVGTYGDSTPEPVLTVAVDKMLVARRDLDNSVVYQLVSELLRLRPALAARRPGLFKDLSADFEPGRSTFVLHAGAQAYLERSEPTVYERYSGIAEVAVTAMIAIITAAIGVLRIYNVRRKNRIDTYYSEVIAIRKTISDDCGPNERQQLVKKLRALQDKAFAELVDEKLAADESFRIFVTLSNDVLRQLATGITDSNYSDH